MADEGSRRGVRLGEDSKESDHLSTILRRHNEQKSVPKTKLRNVSIEANPLTTPDSFHWLSIHNNDIHELVRIFSRNDYENFAPPQTPVYCDCRFQQITSFTQMTITMCPRKKRREGVTIAREMSKRVQENNKKQFENNDSENGSASISRRPVKGRNSMVAEITNLLHSVGVYDEDHKEMMENREMNFRILQNKKKAALLKLQAVKGILPNKNLTSGRKVGSQYVIDKAVSDRVTVKGAGIFVEIGESAKIKKAQRKSSALQISSPEKSAEAKQNNDIVMRMSNDTSANTHKGATTLLTMAIGDESKKEGSSEEEANHNESSKKDTADGENDVDDDDVDEEDEYAYATANYISDFSDEGEEDEVKDTLGSNNNSNQVTDGDIIVKPSSLIDSNDTESKEMEDGNANTKKRVDNDSFSGLQLVGDSYNTDIVVEASSSTTINRESGSIKEYATKTREVYLLHFIDASLNRIRFLEFDENTSNWSPSFIIGLNLSENLLVSLIGIEACINLRFLNCKDNLLTSMTSLRGCRNLRRLEISGNRLNSLSLLTEDEMAHENALATSTDNNDNDAGAVTTKERKKRASEFFMKMDSDSKSTYQGGGNLNVIKEEKGNLDPSDVNNSNSVEVGENDAASSVADAKESSISVAEEDVDTATGSTKDARDMYDFNKENGSIPSMMFRGERMVVDTDTGRMTFSVPHLQYLNASNNPLEDLQGIRSFCHDSIIHLELRNCGLLNQHIISLENFHSIKRLHLDDNNMDDINACIPYFQGLSKLEHLSLLGNPMSGREKQWDPQEDAGNQADNGDEEKSTIIPGISDRHLNSIYQGLSNAAQVKFNERTHVDNDTKGNNSVKNTTNTTSNTYTSTGNGNSSLYDDGDNTIHDEIGPLRVEFDGRQPAKKKRPDLMGNMPPSVIFADEASNEDKAMNKSTSVTDLPVHDKYEVHDKLHAELMNNMNHMFQQGILKKAKDAHRSAGGDRNDLSYNGEKIEGVNRMRSTKFVFYQISIINNLPKLKNLDHLPILSSFRKQLEQFKTEIVGEDVLNDIQKHYAKELEEIGDVSKHLSERHRRSEDVIKKIIKDKSDTVEDEMNSLMLYARQKLKYDERGDADQVIESIREKFKEAKAHSFGGGRY